MSRSVLRASQGLPALEFLLVAPAAVWIVIGAEIDLGTAKADKSASGRSDPGSMRVLCAASEHLGISESVSNETLLPLPGALPDVGQVHLSKCKSTGCSHWAVQGSNLRPP